MLKFILPIFLSVILTACGGSGSKGNSAQASSFSSTNHAVSSYSSNSSVAAQKPTASTAPPKGVYAIRKNDAATLYWEPAVGAFSYNIYIATEAGIAPENIGHFLDGQTIKNVQPPYTITGLSKDKPWHLVVTTSNATGESVASQEIRVAPSELDPALEPTPQEVLVIELINRARANPQAEADLYGIDLNEGIEDKTISADSKQPLALNTQLQTAARSHSRWMLIHNIFSHTGIGGSTPSERNRTAGFVLNTPWRTGENISVVGPVDNNNLNLTNMVIKHHQNLFKSPGHRLNILNGDFRNIGVGQDVGNYTFDSGNTYYSSMLTESYAKSGQGYFLTGVAYEDINNNNFYDVGEALSDITLEVDGQRHPVFSSGAYSIPLASGNYIITIRGSAAGFPIQHAVTITEQNVKMNIVKTRHGIEIQ